GDRGEQPVAVEVERAAHAVHRLGYDVVVGVVDVRLGDGSVPGCLRDAVARVIGVAEGVGQVGAAVVGGHQLFDVLGHVAVGVVGVGVLGDRAAVGLGFYRVLERQVSEVAVGEGVAVGLHLASELSGGAVGERRYLRRGVGG